MEDWKKKTERDQENAGQSLGDAAAGGGFHGEAASATGIGAHEPAILIIVIRFPGVPLLPLFPVITSENYSLAAPVYGGNFS